MIAAVFLVLIILSFNKYRLKGLHSDMIIGTAFISITVIYFAFIKNSKRKLITSLFLAPLVAIGLLNLSFGQITYESKIGNDYKIQVTTGGLLSCGELIHITKTEFLIFDKEVLYEGNLCLREIERIETINFNNDFCEFLIYHDGEMDSENPYRYMVRNENLW